MLLKPHILLWVACFLILSVPHKGAFLTPPVFAEKNASALSHNEYPVNISIPSVRLDSPIEKMGLDVLGRMDVPDGKTNNVGWYEAGTVPGEIGSAVFAAHVYAAFKNLKKVTVGDEIIVRQSNGEELRFIVEERIVYQLSELSPSELFNRQDARRLTLITCAGQPTGDERGYSHRLVVYTKLAP